jgi:branched-chain amino acid transport system substrate-binding protein
MDFTMLGRNFAFACALAALLVPPAANAADTTPFEINVILPITGSGAFSGDAGKNGLRALEAMVNAQGGINGRPVKFVISDDATNPQTVVQLTNQIAAKKVAVIIGPSTSQECAAAFPVIEENGPVAWCLSPAMKIPKAGSYAFMIGPPMIDQLPFDFRYFKSRGFRNIGVIVATDTTGQDFDKNLDITLALPDLRDMKVVAHEHFTASDISVAAQVARIKSANPDVIIAYTTGTPFATVLRGVKDAGMSTPVFTSGGNLNKTLVRQYASVLPAELLFNGARGVIPDTSSTGKMKVAQAAYFDALKKAGTESNYSLLGVWDPAMILVDAFRQLGTDATASQLHEYLEKLKGWTGVMGTFDFTTGNQRGVPVEASRPDRPPPLALLCHPELVEGPPRRYVDCGGPSTTLGMT